MHTYALKNQKPIQNIDPSKKSPICEKKFQMRESELIAIIWICFDIWNFKLEQFG